MSQGKFHLHWASPTRSILWFLSSLTLLCLSSYFSRSSYMEIPFFLLSSSVTTSISIQLQVLHLILKCPFPFKSVYTTFLSTEWGGGFLMQRFIVNKSKPILFLGCSFCALKNFKKKKKRLHTAGLKLGLCVEETGISSYCQGILQWDNLLPPRVWTIR